MVPSMFSIEGALSHLHATLKWTQLQWHKVFILQLLTAHHTIT